jgi:hypothetical protein
MMDNLLTEIFGVFYTGGVISQTDEDEDDD